MPRKTSTTTKSADVLDKMVNIRIPIEVWKKIEILSIRKEYDDNASAVVRDALKYFIDNEEDIIGSRGHFQKTLRDRIDALEKRQTEQLQAVVESVNKQLGNLAQAFVLEKAETRSKSDSNSDSKLTTILLELHTILHLLIFSFSKMLPRFYPEAKELANIAYLLNTHVTEAIQAKQIYETTINTADKIITPTPFTEENLIPKKP